MVEELRVASIKFNVTNPRRTFNEARMAELTESVRRHGVLEPILVRTVTWDDEGPQSLIELVAGERRLRAATAAGLETIPARMLELTDKEALEIQVIENLQREDLHPMEEAEGFRRLHEVHGYAVEELALKVGKSESYIYARMRLAKLPERAIELFLADGLTLGLAVLVAQIPDPKQQVRAANLFAGLQENGKPAPRWQRDEEDNPKAPYHPVTLADARNTIRHEFSTELDIAPWDLNDATLVEAAGPCTTCPKRTSAQALLFGELYEGKGDRCLDQPCFAAKRKVHGDRLVAAARATGNEVLTGKTAEKAVNESRSWQRGTYLDLTQTVDRDPKRQPLAKRLGPSVEEIGKVVAVTPDGMVHELIHRQKATKALREKFTWAGPSTSSVSSASSNAAYKKEQAKRKAEEAARGAVIGELVQHAEAKAPSEVWSLLAQLAIGSWGGCERTLERRGIVKSGKESPFDTLARYLEGIGQAKARGLLLELLLWEAHGGGKDKYRLLDAACAVFDVDRAAIERAHRAAPKAAGAAVKPAAKGKAKRRETKAAKGGTKTALSGTKRSKRETKPAAAETLDVQTCRKCGCTDLDCQSCIVRTGAPCAWVEDDLCSACVDPGQLPTAKAKRGLPRPRKFAAKVGRP